MNNPNNFRFKITKMEIHIISANDTLGTLTEIDKIIVPAKSELPHKFAFEFEYPDIISGGLSLIKFFSKKEMELKIAGIVVVKAFGVKKTVEVNEEFIMNMSKKKGS
jgi:hypothetical protein